jgi:hypothetical protein
MNTPARITGFIVPLSAPACRTAAEEFTNAI